MSLPCLCCSQDKVQTLSRLSWHPSRPALRPLCRLTLPIEPLKAHSLFCTRCRSQPFQASALCSGCFPCPSEQLLILPGPSHVSFSTNTLQHLPPPHWRLSMAPWCTVRSCALPSLPAWPLVTSSPCLPHQGGSHQPRAPPT